jgi:YhcH/YjgK/YiaL family protein
MNKNSVLIFIVATLSAFWLTSCYVGKENKKIKMVTVTNSSIESKFHAKPDKSINFEQVEEHYKKYPERWNAAFTFLIESNLSELDSGRYDPDKEVYAMVSEYETKNPEDARFESHQQYIDLQYIISGKEIIGWTNDKNLKVISPYSETKDITFYDFDGGTLLPASPDNYFIFFPDDIHKPCIKTKGSDKVRKVVVKIKY